MIGRNRGLGASKQTDGRTDRPTRGVPQGGREAHPQLLYAYKRNPSVAFGITVQQMRTEEVGARHWYWAEHLVAACLVRADGDGQRLTSSHTAHSFQPGYKCKGLINVPYAFNIVRHLCPADADSSSPLWQFQPPQPHLPHSRKIVIFNITSSHIKMNSNIQHYKAVTMTYHALTLSLFLDFVYLLKVWTRQSM
jgi:hypothetical protein